MLIKYNDLGKVLTKDEMKKVFGGNAPVDVCGDPEHTYSCSVYSNGTTWNGECGSINGRCKCSTQLGDYQTANDHYGCEDMLPIGTIQ